MTRDASLSKLLRDLDRAVPLNTMSGPATDDRKTELKQEEGQFEGVEVGFH